VRKGAEKLQKFLNSKQQGRLDGFFSVKPKEKTSPKKDVKGKGKADTKTKGTKRKVRLLVVISPGIKFKPR
jgi:flap endonuclease-1